MKTSISSHYSDFQPSFKYKFFELENAIHTSSKIPVTIWSLNLSDFIRSNQNYTADKIQSFIEKMRISLNALKRIFHPNLLRIYETSDEDTEPNVLSFSSERIKFCLDGSGCKKSSETENLFTRDESLFIASQISDGLSYLHDQLSVASFGICPENIFITPNFEVKIGSLIHFSKFSEPLSTVEPNLYPAECSIFDIDKRFLSPELKSHNNVTSKADVFMFGLTVLYCYEGENFLNEMISSQSSQTQYLLDFLNGSNSSNTSEDMKVILSKCFSEEPSERPTFQQLSNSNALTQLPIKVLNFIDTIEEKPVENHKSFYRGLGGIIDKYSERILLLKIIPILVRDAYTNSDDESLLLEHILPMILTASNKLPANKIDSIIVKRLFEIQTCQNFFLENSHKLLTNADEINEIREKIPFIGAVTLNCYLYEETKEKGKYLVKLLFEKSANLDQDEFKEIVLEPLFKSPDCAILLLYYIQTLDEDEEDSDFQNLAVFTISYAVQFIQSNDSDEKSPRLEQKVLDLIPKLLEYGKSMKLKTFQTLILDPVLKNPEMVNVLLENLNLFDDPDNLALIAKELKANNDPSYKKVFPILMTKVGSMKPNDFEENVFKPFFFTDSSCALSMIENIGSIQTIDSNSQNQQSDDSQPNSTQSIIINSYKSKDETIRSKVPASIPYLFTSLTPNQKTNSNLLKEKIFGPFYENFSTNPTKDQEKCIIQLIKNTPQDPTVIDTIISLTFDNCSSNEQIMNEISKLLPSYASNCKEIKAEVIETLIKTNQFTSSMADNILANASSIKDVNTKMFILKYALENANESTDYEKLASLFVEVSNSQEFVKEYNGGKFREVQPTFVDPLFQNIESADYLISNFELFDHQYPTSKRVQMLIVTEISSLVNNMMAAGQDCSALSSAIPDFLKLCSPEIGESLQSLQAATDSINDKEPIDYPYISTILDSLNGAIKDDLAPKCSKYLRGLFKKIITDNDEGNKKLMINKIATVLTSLPPYSNDTTEGVCLSIELVENSYIEAEKREQLLDFINQVVSSIRGNKDFKPSNAISSSQNDDNNNKDDDGDDDNNNNDDDDNQKKDQDDDEGEKSEEVKEEKNDDNIDRGNRNPFDSDESSSSENNNKNPFDTHSAPNSNQDPFAFANNEQQQPFSDPFAQSSDNNPFGANNDPFNAAAADAATTNNNDPFNTAPADNNNDPFNTASADNNDPFNTASNNDPFKSSPANNDPFNTASANNNDPFNTASNNDPFKSAPANNDPFSNASNSNDPFKSAPANNDPFKSAPANNDPFKTASDSNDPFKAATNNNDDQNDGVASPPSSQSSSNTNHSASNSAPQPFPSQSTTKSVKIETKQEKKQKEKEKKKQEKMEKKQKAKDKKSKEKERRKSRNDIPIETPNHNPFSTPSNAVDPFKSLERSPNHFNKPIQQPSPQMNPFASNASSPNQNNPFSSQQASNNDPFKSSSAPKNPFMTQPANNNNTAAAAVDPFAASPVAGDQDNDDDDDDSSHSHHHHHHHHHHDKQKPKANESDNADFTAQRRESRPNVSRKRSENCQSIQPSFGSGQNDDMLNMRQRTPSFDIFSNTNAPAQKMSSFESDNKATSDAKIDFNNDELDFDD